MKALRKQVLSGSSGGVTWFVFRLRSSRYGGQLVDEVIDGVHHEPDVILVGHAVLPLAPEDDVYVVAQHAIRNL